MIVGTHFGLFMPALRPDWKKCIENGEPELQVRSRRKVDLLNLKAFMEEIRLVLGEPFAIKNTDYQWRAYTTRYEWSIALASIAQEIDYTKFKDTPEKKHGDKKLTDAYSAIWSATLRSFPTGSIYSARSRHTQTHNTRVSDPRVVETVYRTENREWRMSGASPAQLADLMREIDAATEGVELPTDEELNELERNGVLSVTDSDRDWAAQRSLNDHSRCTHADSRHARRRCRQKRERS